MDSYPQMTPLPGGAFRLKSPAKINLALRVLGKRPDGFHEIRTVFHEISLADSIEFHAADEWTLEVRGARLDPGPENLITRAAKLLSSKAGVPCRAKVVLVKRIPVGGGLGGGSSNAAVALIGLSRLWNLSLSRSDLVPLAAELGSDCVFFLGGGMAFGSGRGDKVKFVDEKLTGEVVLVTPNFGIDTGWAYQSLGFTLTDDEKSVIFDFYPENTSSPIAPPFQFVNDLEYIVLKRHPELQWAKQRLLDLGGKIVLLSGSGSSVFGVFENEAQAAYAARQFGPPWKTHECRTVGRLRKPD